MEGEIKSAIADELIKDIIRERREERRWRRIKRGAMATGAAILFFVYLPFVAKQTGWSFVPQENIAAVVRIEGEIASGRNSSADKIVPILNDAFKRENVKAIVLKIDSPGGSPTEAERIYKAIEANRKQKEKPVISVIESMGASAAYMIAVHTDKIVAGEYSLIGSIGAVIYSWDLHRALERIDVKQRVFSSGELKAMLSPFIPMTEEAEKKAKDVVEKMGKKFLAEVENRRGEKLRSGVDYGSGEVWTGPEAKELGLIDAIGTLEEAVAELKLPMYDMGPTNPMRSGWLAEAADTVLARLLAW